MTLKQILGWTMLLVFSSFMIYKFYDSISHQKDAILIVALAVVIFLVLLLAIRKIISDA